MSKKKVETLLEKKVKKYVEEQIKPMIQLDGGDVEYVDLDEEEGILKVQLAGACVGCPMSDITLKMGIEREITAKFPEVVEVMTMD